MYTENRMSYLLSPEPPEISCFEIFQKIVFIFFWLLKFFYIRKYYHCIFQKTLHQKTYVISYNYFTYARNIKIKKF